MNSFACAKMVIMKWKEREPIIWQLGNFMWLKFLFLRDLNSHLNYRRPKVLVAIAFYYNGMYSISISIVKKNSSMKSHLDFLLKFEIIHWNMHANGPNSVIATLCFLFSLLCYSISLLSISFTVDPLTRFIPSTL